LRAGIICGAVSLLLAGGCATTGNPRDPLEPLNRAVYTFNDGFDALLVKPAAEFYRFIIPEFARTGVSNFFSNLNDVIVAANNLLQGKATHAASDVGRILVNSTVGVLGLFDIATGLGMEKHNEDFGQTLARWGVGDGIYLVLPLLGPSTLRDTAALPVDWQGDPVQWHEPVDERNALTVTRTVARRADLLGVTSTLEEAALDRYVFLREAYLQRRRSLVYDGRPPRERPPRD
jgi:phospholipid-binding lipoprotein MlaA